MNPIVLAGLTLGALWLVQIVVTAALGYYLLCGIGFFGLAVCADTVRKNLTLKGNG